MRIVDLQMTYTKNVPFNFTMKYGKCSGSIKEKEPFNAYLTLLNKLKHYNKECSNAK